MDLVCPHHSEFKDGRCVFCGEEEDPENSPLRKAERALKDKINVFVADHDKQQKLLLAIGAAAINFLQARKHIGDHGIGDGNEEQAVHDLHLAVVEYYGQDALD